tara:strand:+ start:8460 stop:9890 length:1431 start_codon:yes stop_codon:yes gene_type:complete
MKNDYDLVAVENFLWTPHIQTSLDILISSKCKKKAFCYLDIDNPDNPDIPNNRFKIFGKKRIIKKISKILNNHKIDLIKIPQDPNYLKSYNYDKIKLRKFDDLKDYKINGYNIGFGIASSLVDRFKQRDPAIKDIKKKILTRYIKTSHQVLISIEKLHKIYKFKKILTFNGRFAHAAVIKNFCYKKKIKTLFHERTDSKFRYFLNRRPVHDMEWWREDAVKLWHSSKLKKETKYKIGQKWFENRLNNKYADGLEHRKFQVKGKIPSFIKKEKKIVTFFSHSDEEYAYCQELKHPIFKDQRKAIIWLINYFKGKKNIDFILRIHPNLLNKNIKDIKWWHNLKRKFNFNNFYLIKSNSKIDSYSLVKNSDVAINFCSSSIALESTYLGTPSIIIGDSQYRSTDCAYHPMNINELKNLLKQKKIKPKRKKNALKFAFFRSTYGYDFKYYKPVNNYEGKFLGEKFDYYPEFISYLKKIIS